MPISAFGLIPGDSLETQNRSLYESRMDIDFRRRPTYADFIVSERRMGKGNVVTGSGIFFPFPKRA